MTTQGLNPIVQVIQRNKKDIWLLRRLLIAPGRDKQGKHRNTQEETDSVFHPNVIFVKLLKLNLIPLFKMESIECHSILNAPIRVE